MDSLTFESLTRWEEGDVTAWLQSIRLGSYSSVFARNDITGVVLLDVDQHALKEMGITSVGDRIRIYTAIKNLKKKCSEAERFSRLQLQQAQGDIEYLDSDRSHLSGAAGLRRNASTRPPPLHLSQSAQDIPMTPSHPSPQQTYSGQGLGLREARGLTSTGQGRVGNTLASAMSATHRSPSSSNRQLIEGDVESYGHRKMNSLGAPSTAFTAQQQRLHQQAQLIASDQRMSASAYTSKRPSTAYIESGRIGPGSSTNSPTTASFQRPSTSDGGRVLGSAHQAGGVPLTPITEASSASTSGSSRIHNGYTAGRAVLGQQGTRPITPGHMSNSTTPLSAHSNLSDSSRSTALSLEDVKRRTIKFIGEDGTTRIVPVSDCRDAFDVLARVLKKFGKPAVGNSYIPTAGQSATDEDVVTVHDDAGDQWGIFATSGEGQTKYLTDNELLAICHAPQPHDPLRERGLTIRRINRMEDSGKRPSGKRSKLEYIFGEDPQKRTHQGASPNMQAGHYNLDDGLMDAALVSTGARKLNRASTSSILTGLGAPTGSSSSSSTMSARQALQREAKDHQQRSPSGGMASSILPKKARNFFGQRPPSELISSHLADYFPSTEKRVLERTARKSVYGRPSTSIRSKRDSTWSYAADPEGAPPLPSKEYAPAILIGMESSEDVNAAKQRSDNKDDGPLIAKASLAGWSETPNVGQMTVPSLRGNTRPVSLRRASVESSKSRRSLATQLRMARGIGGSEDRLSSSNPSGKGSSAASGIDRSDAASMMTVDEITQEVENRRESMYNIANSGGGWVVDEDGVPIPIPASSRTAMSPSLAASSRASSALSLQLDYYSNDVDEDKEEGDDDRTSTLERSPNANAPGDEADRHMGDPMAVNRNTTSQASVVSELRNGRMSDDEEGALQGGSDGDELDSGDDYDDDDDLSEEDDDEEGGVFQSALPGKEPIKWIKGALIGAGSFGNVFLGMNAKNGLLMAVKQVELPSGDSHSDQRKKSMLEALEREIELLKTMQHENIVQYLDSYADGTHLNIFLEYVPGGSVVALLRNYGAFEEPLVRNFVKQILHGLQFLHDRDIVHRDIKGANILVDNKSCIKISDFGISKKVESDLLVSARTHRPSLQGSVYWMAPEVVKQTSYTRKADIWSLGCLIVEMISGTHPWANLNQMQALFKIGSLAKPQLPEDISPEAVDFLNKTFELDHNKRPSADELLQHAFITEEFSLAAPAATGAAAAAPNGGPASNGTNGAGGHVPSRSNEAVGDETVTNIKSRSKTSGTNASKKAREVTPAAETGQEEG